MNNHVISNRTAVNIGGDLEYSVQMDEYINQKPLLLAATAAPIAYTMGMDSSNKCDMQLDTPSEQYSASDELPAHLAEDKVMLRLEVGIVFG